MTSETLDRVLQEAFRLNESLFRSCKLTYASTPLQSTTVVALAGTLSDIDDHEIMIIKTPQKPLSIVDIKTVFMTMLNECKCCSTNAPDTTVLTYESEDDGDITIKLCSLSLPSSPRAFSLLHHVAEISNGLVSICPSFCNVCDDMKCGACNFRTCLQCHESICGDCENVENCSDCAGFKCFGCDTKQCSECNKVLCDTCAGQNEVNIGFCSICESYKCSECSNVISCGSDIEYYYYSDDCHNSICKSCFETENHYSFRSPNHWICDDCQVMCEGCNEPCCLVYWEGCGFINCGICGKDKCWENCFNYIKCGKCDQAICNDCESDIKFCNNCHEVYCYPKCWDNPCCKFRLCGKCLVEFKETYGEDMFK